MFGFSIQKLILLAAVVAAVWYGFKFLGRLQETRKAEAKLREGKAAKPARQPRESKKDSAGGPDASGQVEDLVQCPACGAYVRAGSTCSCGHET